MRRPRPRMPAAAATLALVMALSAVPPAHAAVNVERSGAENPMVEIARSTYYGGLAGLLVGGAIALAADSDNSGDILRWGFVTGTFVGLGFGLYHVTHRAQAFLEIEEGETRLGIAMPELTPSGTRLTLMRAAF